jgi:hypothetical protein
MFQRKTKYRVVRDSYNGYEAQFRPWWSPIWFQCFGTNTEPSLERSLQVCKLHAKPVITYYDPYKQNA